MAIARSTPGSKLLARHEHDNASFPFAAGDWEKRTGGGETISVVSGRLRIDGGNAGGAMCLLRHVAGGSRSKRMVYAVTRNVSGNTGGHIYIGAGAHGSTDEDDHVAMAYTRGEPSDTLLLMEHVNFAYQGGSTSSVATRSTNTDYASTLFVDGTSTVGRDHTATTTLTRTATTQASGYGGVAYWAVAGANVINEGCRYFDCPDRYTLVLGVPAGGSAEVRTSGDVLLGSPATESGGTATIDMLTVALEAGAKLVVKNSGGTVVDTYDAGALGEIVEPGETYTCLVPATQSLLITGTTPTVTTTAHVTVTPASQSLLTTGTTPTVSLVLAVTPAVQSIRITGYAPSVSSAPRTHGEVVLSHAPTEYWHLEETSSNFATAVGGGSSATAGNVIAERGVAAICNGIRAYSPVGTTVPATIFDSTGPDFGVVSGDKFAFSQWVKPGTDNNKACLVPAFHGGNGTGIYGLGLMVFEGGLQVWLHGENYINGTLGAGYYSDPITRYTGADVTLGAWHHVAVEVEKLDSFVTIRLYLDGNYCDDLSGTYSEFHRPLGTPLGSGQANFLGVSSTPYYGRSDWNVNIDWLYGTPWVGSLDEVAWYSYLPGEHAWAAQYDAGRATLEATPAGSFTSPLGGTSTTAGSTLTVAWGAATGASGYQLEVRYDGGAWSTLAYPTTNSYAHTLPEATRDSVEYRATPLFYGYLPESCVVASLRSTSGAMSSDPATLCSLQLDVYADDRTTVLWTVSTDPAHATPYLEEPNHYGEQEIDVVGGAATIGQVEVCVVDRRITAGDQDSGWLTSKLALGIHGRRCRLRRSTADGWVLVADGAAGTPRMDDSYSAFRWTIRDTRDRERKTKAFLTSDTVAIAPRGPTVAFAGITVVDHLIGDYYTDDGVVVINFRPRYFGLSGSLIDADDTEIIITPEHEELLQPTRVVPDGLFKVHHYENVVLDWRTSSSGAFANTWAPTSREVSARVSLAHVTNNKVVDANGELVAVRAINHIKLGTVTIPDAPAPGTQSSPTTLYVRLRAVAGKTSEAWPYHVTGTAGTVLQNLYDGVYSPRHPDTGAIQPTGIRYDAAALALMTDTVVLRVTEPADDIRAWAEKYIYAPTGYVPAINLAGEISPVSQAIPASFAGATAITSTITEATPSWNAGERILNHLIFRYPRYYVPADPAIPVGGDGLAKVEVTYEQLDAMSIARHEEHKVEYDGRAFAATGSSTGAAIGEDSDTATQNEMGSRLAQNRKLHVLDRFRMGAQAVDVVVRRSSAGSVKVGDWVTVALSWMPNTSTGRRSMSTTGQVIAIGELDCAWRRFLIEEGAVRVGGVIPLQTLTASATASATLPIQTMAGTLDVTGGVIPLQTLAGTITVT